MTTPADGSTAGPGPEGADPTVVVAMLTYRRPEDLAAAVPAFLAAVAGAAADVRLLVVDNDPAGSGRDVVAAVGDERVRYVVEPTPGIAAGRNRALREAEGADLLVFVDDDERPEPGWFDALLGTWRQTRPTCVVGAVVSAYAQEPTGWLAAGRFFDRRRLPTGTAVDVAATNNLLIDLRQLAGHGVTFDERFGLSGGSDTLFTRTLARRGARLVWCDEAVVVDMVPDDRLTRDWVLRRARRSGNSAARVEVVLAVDGAQRAQARARYLVRGTVRMAAGGARMAVGALTRSEVHHAKGARSLHRGLGMASGALGSVVVEYARP
ncbi:glycosyltransferase family 2 protein [Cellulomonas endophytica]|uniref:glycosyltransferase family 2 protein n=1 Tax=Cellulomonas endophytica TaxID=2494735 RepID=UPI001F0C2533|nr:glycosyltransferase family A protein [Cellulomonas endophytica]